MKIYRKLVRDRIPEIILAAGERPVTRVLSDKEYFHELLVKLGEESKEVLGAEADKTELAKEFGDVIEVLESAIKVSGISREEIEKVRTERLKKRGGFEKKIFLEKTE